MAQVRRRMALRAGTTRPTLHEAAQVSATRPRVAAVTYQTRATRRETMKQQHAKKFAPNSGQQNVPFEHEIRGGSSPAEKRDGPLASPVTISAARTAPPKRTEHDH